MMGSTPSRDTIIQLAYNRCTLCFHSACNKSYIWFRPDAACINFVCHNCKYVRNLQIQNFGVILKFLLMTDKDDIFLRENSVFNRECKPDSYEQLVVDSPFNDRT